MAGERWELSPLLGVDLILMCVTVAAFICHMCGPVEPSSALPSGNLTLPIPKPAEDEKHYVSVMVDEEKGVLLLLLGNTPFEPNSHDSLFQMITFDLVTIS